MKNKKKNYKKNLQKKDKGQREEGRQDKGKTEPRWPASLSSSPALRTCTLYLQKDIISRTLFPSRRSKFSPEMGCIRYIERELSEAKRTLLSRAAKSRNGSLLIGAFSRLTRLIAIERDWLLLLEPTNQRRVLIRRQLSSCSVERGQCIHRLKKTVDLTL